MRRRYWTLATTAILVVAAAAGGMATLTPGEGATSAEHDPPPTTAPVEEGTLSTMVSLDGTLTHRARPDGSAYVAVNRGRGTYTRLPEIGDRIGCGGVLYRVDDRPVLLLCGDVPAYRDLSAGDHGADVRQLNRSLHALGYDREAAVAVRPGDADFTWQTQQALERLQHDKGLAETGALSLDEAVFLPAPVRVSKVTGTLGGAARPGGAVVTGTSDTPEVQVLLDASQQGEVKKGDRALITLPGNTSVKGRVRRLGRVAESPAGPDGNAAATTIPAYLSLSRPNLARGLDAAPVQVDITTEGVHRALSVPVTALVGRSGGGFAVEVVRDDGRRGLVRVRLGLFDSSGGRVQVAGALHPGDDVVVPSP